MARQRRSPEQIIRLLKQADVLASQGKSVAEICREISVSDATYYKWRKEYGGMGMDQARKLKELEVENKRLKRAGADLTLDNQILKEVNTGMRWLPSKTSTARSSCAASRGRGSKPRLLATSVDSPNICQV